MSLDNLTIGEAKQLAAMFGNTNAKAGTDLFSGKYVIVRTFSAGVHVGVVQSRNGKEVVLTEAKRIWSWSGANTLSEISLDGINAKGSKVSDQVDTILLTEAIEVIPMSAKAEKCLRSANWN